MTCFIFLMTLSSENLLCSPKPSFSFLFLPKVFFSLKGLFDNICFLIFDWIDSLIFLSIILLDSSSSLSFFSSKEILSSFWFELDGSLYLVSITISIFSSFFSFLFSEKFFEGIFSFSFKYDDSWFILYSFISSSFSIFSLLS